MKNRFFSLVLGVLLCTSMQARVQGDFNPYDQSILTVAQWWSDVRYIYGEDMQSAITVKGVVHEEIGDLDEGKLTFRLTDDGKNDWENDQPYVFAYSTLGLNGKAFAGKDEVQAGDTLYVTGYYKIRTLDAGYYVYSEPMLANGYIAFAGTPASLPVEESGNVLS